jgi:cardiolipin synthase
VTTFKPYFLFFLITFIFNVITGCATLPNVSETIDEAPMAQKPRQILSSKGLLSPQKSKAIMARLKRSVDPTDILGRHITVVEAVTESPLTKGNKVTLLADGPVAYSAMLKAIQNAKDHINLESYIIENDETGQKFADLLLQKQAKGVQVNLIYDSIGSMNTPPRRDSGYRI